MPPLVLLGHSAQAQKQLQEGIGILRVLGVEEELTTPLNYLAYLAYCTDQYALALQLSSEASEIAKKRGDKLGIADAYRTAAAIREVKGDLSGGLNQYEQALAAYQEIDNHQGTCWSLLSLSTCASKMGDYERAITRAKDVINLSQQIGFRLVEGWSLYALGCIYVRQCDYDAAIKTFEQALRVGRTINDQRQQGSVLNRLGTCKHYQGDLIAARIYYEQALTICRQINNVLGEGLALNDLGILERYHKDYAVCQQLCQHALEISQRIENRDLQRRAFTSLGHLYVAQARYIQATDAYKQALDKIDETQLQTRLHPLSGLALIAVYQDNKDQARQLMNSVLTILDTHKIDGSDEPQYLQQTIDQVLHAIG